MSCPCKLASRQKGVGLLELMLSLAIIALVMIMATRYFSVTQDQQKVTQTLQMVSNALQAVHTWGGDSTQYTAPKALLGVLVDAQLLPAAYKGNLNPWGGEFDLKGKASPYLLELHLGSIPGGSNGAFCKSFNDRITASLSSGGYKLEIICG
jgi:prepilin-type N-terminal cleavage/methylation domain-containing protein